MKLLVVDFDFFFPVIERPEDSRFPGEWSLYDWGHSEEDRVLYETVWPVRAAAFIASGNPLPQIDRDALGTFWQRFDLDPRATLFYADSNLYAGHKRITRGADDVWLFDAHHDSGYHPDAWQRALRTHEVTCENWMLAHYANDATLHMRYPQWRHYGPEIEPRPVVPVDQQVDDGEPVEGRFGRVFVCKSPAWVAPWADRDWQEFIERAPFRRKINMDESKMVRDFDHRTAESFAVQLGEAMRLRAERAGGNPVA